MSTYINDCALTKLVGDFSPAYLYGTVKVRPIISQCPTATYNLAKYMNKLLIPYCPHQFSLRSSQEFVDLIHGCSSDGIMASLDVESLFTNVPVEDTILLICDYVYRHSSLPPLPFPEELLADVLRICTLDSPFRHPGGGLFVQIDCVAMGSPLGPLFANYYMGHLESAVFETFNNKPLLYARYVDDIFILVASEKEILDLKEKFEEQSVLTFTYENSSKTNQLAFLDTLVTKTSKGLTSSVYVKPSNSGVCLNFNSECPDRYKASVVYSYLIRAYKLSEDWNSFHEEIIRIKQLLVNNNYTNAFVDNIIYKFVSCTVQCNSNEADVNVSTHLHLGPGVVDEVPLFYCNQMHPNYALDERAIKQIIRRLVTLEQVLLDGLQCTCRMEQLKNISASHTILHLHVNSWMTILR